MDWFEALVEVYEKRKREEGSEWDEEPRIVEYSNFMSGPLTVSGVDALGERAPLPIEYLVGDEE
ncbi:hypothetical protein CL618_03350 [archaeon]|nr:hypothetical protein [archaeon]|tara:strand:- start:1297 stop:1488 length:192 start_codon:yes stop_codon:yes gene_type:complete